MQFPMDSVVLRTRPTISSCKGSSCRSTPFRSYFALLLAFCLPFLSAVQAAKNITLDDTSPLLTFRGDWQGETDRSGFVTGGHYMLGIGDAYINLTFEFTGTALYLHYPLFPMGPVEMSTGRISIDGSDPPFEFPLNDTSIPLTRGNGNTFGSPKGRTTFSFPGLSAGTHELVIKPGLELVIFDGLTYTDTEDDPPVLTETQTITTIPTTGASTISFPQATTSDAPTKGPGSNRTVAIAAAVSAVAVALVAAALLFFFCKRRRDRRERSPTDINGTNFEGKTHYQASPSILVHASHGDASYRDLSAPALSHSHSPLTATHHLQPSSEALLQGGLYPSAHGHAHLNPYSLVESVAPRRSNLAPVTLGRDTNCLSYATDSTAVGAPNALKPSLVKVEQDGKIIVPQYHWGEGSSVRPQGKETRRLMVRNEEAIVPTIGDASAPPAYDTLDHTPPPVPEKTTVVLRYPGSTGAAAPNLAVPSGSGTNGDAGVRRAKSVA